MKSNLWIWGTSALVIVVIPVSILVFSGNSSAEENQTDLVVVTGHRSGASKNAKTKSIPNSSSDVSESSLKSSANTAVVDIEESLPLNSHGALVASSPLTVNALTMTETNRSHSGFVGLDNLTGTGFFGGDDETGSLLDPIEPIPSEVNDAERQPVAEVKKDKSKEEKVAMVAVKSDVETSDLPADFPLELLGGAPGKKPKKKLQKGNEKEDQRPRVEVTVLRPRNEFVKSREDVIGHSKAKGKPIVLVRSRQVGSTWWVQEVMPRKGRYFRAMAQFGNLKTADGTRFQYVIAFVPDDEDVPETGTNYREIPPEFLVSKEFDAVVDKAKK